MFQFLNHVNAYTKTAYKNDPDVIGFEISNEPHHREGYENVTAFINRMVKAMRSTGCRKPVFYNITHSIHMVDAYFKSDINGGTFQWYPTGLGAGHELGGNFLPNVDVYKIPFADHPKFKPMAKIVYEFDAADIGRSYIYPAMARSFRQAGMQVATHFAYDPTFMAHVNTEYGTHYMNLAYAPQKALSLMIASEAFHVIPLNRSYESYPANTSFDGFRIDYQNDLAEYISNTTFLYTNATTSVPSSLTTISQIAGYSNSPVVSYEGMGAYFLDRIEAGVWRLEVMPDAIWTDDPFKKTSPKKEVVKINWRTWTMTVNLPDLEEEFGITGVNEGNKHASIAKERSFEISPGTYLLVRKNQASQVNESIRFKNITISEFKAPQPSLDQTYVLHEPTHEVTVNTSYTVNATVVSVHSPQSVTLHVRGNRYAVLTMEHVGGYRYRAILPPDIMSEGFLRYHIVVNENNVSTTFPSGIETHPFDWDFFDREPYQVRVVSAHSPLYLFNALTDTDYLMRQWIKNSFLVPLAEPGKAELIIQPDKLFTQDVENRKAEPVYDYSFRYFTGDKIAGRKNDFSTFDQVVVRARSLNDKICKLQVALIMKDGSAYGNVIDIEPRKKDYTFSLGDMKKVKLVILPRPYPTFLPYYFSTSASGKLKLDEVESLQFSIGPAIPVTEVQDKHGIAIESVRME